jgi:hypothetical protein
VVGQEVESLSPVESSARGGRLDFLLNLVRVDNFSQVGVAEQGSLQVVARLQEGLVSVGAEELVQVSECRLGPDDESSELAAGGELEQVQPVHVHDLNTGHISESLHQLGVLVEVNNEGSLSHSVPLVPEAPVTGPDAPAVHHLLDVLEGADSLQEGHRVLGSLVGLELVLNHQRDLGDRADSVSSGQNERHHAAGSDRRGGSVSLLLGVHSSVPPSPRSQGSEHASLPAHVAERTLATSMSTTSGHSRDTSHGSSRAPGFGTVLHTGLDENTMSLSSVSREILVNEPNNVWSDWCSEDSREGDVLLQNLVRVVDAKN